ncbi:hypothetical protein SJAG_00837 [Schizosaccharomyces japonicus yFS275]|uniref:Uncharacterized protein n=1 Tax=Schizosaccharomyces japonicus (strain yFS275 / FY16936) TaxID=402676 RepID=B6JWQ9_SCHJY|nr:hypothetical protein SJAG_00837 [Schizosaccharomyces japonicus yFS275]EEB05810.2 hypothetical protein SJAG_00837 [Schizosaccharomyces japonicus yFS275]
MEIYYELAMSLNLPDWIDDRAANRFKMLVDLPSCPDESCISNVCEHPIDRRFLTVADLQLDWRLAFKLMKKQLFRLEQCTTSVLSRHSFDAVLIRAASAFFPAEETNNVLNEVLPLFSLSDFTDALAAVGMLSLLLPTSILTNVPSLNPQTWLPTIFHLHSLFTKNVVADTMLFDILSRLAVSGLNDGFKYSFSEYGIFTPEQARTLFHYGLRLFNADDPEGMSLFSNSKQYTVMSKFNVYPPDGVAFVPYSEERTAMYMFDAENSNAISKFAEWIVCSLNLKCEQTEDNILTMLNELFYLLTPYYHLSANEPGNELLFQFLAELSQCFLKRWTYENDEDVTIPREKRLTNHIKKEFVEILKPSVLNAIHSTEEYLRTMAQKSLRALAILEPDAIVPCMLKRIYSALESSVKSHNALVSIESLISLAQVIAGTKQYQPHILPLLELILPGIDSNFCERTELVLKFVAIVSHCVSFYNIDEQLGSGIFLEWFQSEITKLRQMNDDNYLLHDDAKAIFIDYDKVMTSSMTTFCNWLHAFENRIYALLENFPTDYSKEDIEQCLSMTLESLLPALSDEWFDLTLSRLCNFLSTNVVNQAVNAVNKVCAAFTHASPEKTWMTLYPVISHNINVEIDKRNADPSIEYYLKKNIADDCKLVWNLNILNGIIDFNGKYFLDKRCELKELLDRLLLCRGSTEPLASSFVHQLVFNLISAYPTNFTKRLHRPIAEWGKPYENKCLQIHWYIPSEQEIDLAVFICDRYMSLCMDYLQQRVITQKSAAVTNEWVDDVCSYLDWLRLLSSASAELFQIPDIEFLPEYKHDEYNTYTGDYQYIRSKARSRWTISPQQNSVMEALRKRLGFLLVEIHNAVFKSPGYDVMILENVVACEKYYLIDYEYSKSLRRFKEIDIISSPLISYFCFKEAKQPYNTTLLQKRIQLSFLKHLRLSYVPRILTSNEMYIYKQQIKLCYSNHNKVRLIAQASLTSCDDLFRDTRLELFQFLVSILNETENADVLEGSIDALYTVRSLLNIIKRQWVFLYPVLQIIVRLRNSDKPAFQTVALQLYREVASEMWAETYFPIYEHYFVPKIPSQFENEELRLFIIATEQQRQRDINIACMARDEFIDTFPDAHSKTQELILHALYTLSVNFLAPPTSRLLKLFSEGIISSNYTTATYCLAGLFEVLYFVWQVSLSKGDAKDLLSQNIHLPSEKRLKKTPDNIAQIKQTIFEFTGSKKIHYIRASYPGWLAIPDTLDVYEQNYNGQVDFSAAQKLVDTALKLINESWLQNLLIFLIRDPQVDDDSATKLKWRSNIVYTWELLFKILFNAGSCVSSSFLHKQIATLCLSSDRLRNRAGMELLTGFVKSLSQCRRIIAEKHWNWIVPFVTTVMQNNLSSENLEFWKSLIQMVFSDSDPILYWPLYNVLVNMFKNISLHRILDDSKLDLLSELIKTVGWHFQFDQVVYALLLPSLQQSHETHRDIIASVLAGVEHAQIHESHDCVEALLKTNLLAGPLGLFFGKIPTTKVNALTKAYEELGVLRIHATDNSSSKDYAHYASLVVYWTEKLIMLPCGFAILPMVSRLIFPAVLHMLDVKGDKDLRKAATSLLHLLGNLTYPSVIAQDFCEACTTILKNQTSLSQRLHVLAILPPFMFQHSLIVSTETKLSVLETLVTMLHEERLCVREAAAVSMAILIQYFTKPRLDVTFNLRKMLLKDIDTTSIQASVPAEPLPQDNSSEVFAQRYAAILQLLALFNSMPFVGTNAKEAIDDLKMSHSDIWQFMDKYFIEEELNDFE